MSKNIPEDTLNQEKPERKRLPQSVIDEIAELSEEARARFGVPLPMLLVQWIIATDAGKKPVKYNNPLLLPAYGSGMASTEGVENLYYIASYRHPKQCYERFCQRFPMLFTEDADKVFNGIISIEQYYKNTAQLKQLEIYSQYDFGGI